MAFVKLGIPLLGHSKKGKYTPPAKPAITPYLLPKANAVIIGKISDHGILILISPTLAPMPVFENRKHDMPDSRDINIIFFILYPLL